MKVVFDTNVYVAAALGGETATRIFESTIKASWRVFVSEHILDELSKVMLHDLGLPARLTALAIMRARRCARLVEPIPSRHVVAKDAADSAILRTALRSGADYLVTNDRHLLALDPYEGLRIVSMATYRELLERAGLFT